MYIHIILLLAGVVVAVVVLGAVVIQTHLRFSAEQLGNVHP